MNIAWDMYFYKMHWYKYTKFSIFNDKHCVWVDSNVVFPISILNGHIKVVSKLSFQKLD